jgi:hypothetical protein
MTVIITLRTKLISMQGVKHTIKETGYMQELMKEPIIKLILNKKESAIRSTGPKTGCRSIKKEKRDKVKISSSGMVY